VYLIALTEFC